ncbi:hypothetical protein Q1695_009681 [Nippostrongylus brasiliensis]|nr:hypothetical protein Q1695_009681 [Nippostrongylus brasiliensis]
MCDEDGAEDTTQKNTDKNLEPTPSGSSSPPPVVQHTEQHESCHEESKNRAINTPSPEKSRASRRSPSQDCSFSDDSRCEEPPPAVRNGVMDLSRRGISRISRKFRKEYACVKKLIISGNRFSNISGLDMFAHCSQVDAADNQLHKLSSFLPLANNVTALLLSNNAITNIDCLRTFRNLQTLDVSCNDIEAIPAALDNPRLSRVDLSANAISTLPDLTRLVSLRELDVSGNKITTLKNAVFPKSLLSLNICSNQIEDLTEFLRLLYLELDSISLANNPCISNPSFDYRIYILSVLPSLQDIDGFIISEEEQLKGEWLYSQGKGRSFKPDTGSHSQLVAYLERHCPFDTGGRLVSALDQSLVKVMEKRRELLNNSGIDDDSSQSLSLHSPYRAWTAQLEGKENQFPSSSADEGNTSHDSSRRVRSATARVPHSSTPSRAATMTSRACSQFEPLSRTSTMDSVDSSSTVTLIPAVKNNFQGTPPTATTARVDQRSQTFLQDRLDDDLRRNYERGEETQEVNHGQHNPFRPSPTPIVADISIDMGSTRNRERGDHENRMAQRLAQLEDRVCALAEENENLTRINDELSQLLVEMSGKFLSDVNSLRAELDSMRSTCRPQPCNVRVARDLGGGSFEIIWDLPIVKCYKVITNGVESGTVRAPNNAARISDVEPDVELSVQLQAVHLDGTLGEPSQPLTIHTNRR